MQSKSNLCVDVNRKPSAGLNRLSEGFFVEMLPEWCKKCSAVSVCEKKYADRWVTCSHNIYYPEQQVLGGGVTSKTLLEDDLTEDEEGGYDVTRALTVCGSKWVDGDCENSRSHRHYIELLCGKEYCPTCGVKGSKVHKKRIKKAMERLSYIEKFGLLVITVPKEFAELFLDRDKLDSLYKSGIRVAKMVGGGGFARVHFFGDKKESALELHPHLNLLIVGAGYIDSESLESLKVSVGRSFRGILGQDVPVNVHYSYFKKVGDIWRDGKGNACKGDVLRHKVKYITRATIGYERFNELPFDLKSRLTELLEGDKITHKRLILMRWWGNMSNAKYKKTIREELGAGALDNVGKMGCPCCGGKVKYRLVDAFLVPPKSAMIEIAPGVWQLKPGQKWGEDFKSDEKELKKGGGV